MFKNNNNNKISAPRSIFFLEKRNTENSGGYADLRHLHGSWEYVGKKPQVFRCLVSRWPSSVPGICGCDRCLKNIFLPSFPLWQATEGRGQGGRKKEVRTSTRKIVYFGMYVIPGILENALLPTTGGGEPNNCTPEKTQYCTGTQVAFCRRKIKIRANRSVLHYR